jgi:protein arginine N-methyltransferase 5
VSELLGSFGDNELSPECIMAAYSLLTKDAICIPESYTSYLMATTSANIYSKIRVQTTVLEPCEIPYVVNLHNALFFDPAQRVFHFDHSCKTRQSESSTFHKSPSLSCILEFPIKHHGIIMIHGFMGYFEALLYDHIILCK